MIEEWIRMRTAAGHNIFSASVVVVSIYSANTQIRTLSHRVMSEDAVPSEPLPKSLKEG